MPCRCWSVRHAPLRGWSSSPDSPPGAGVVQVIVTARAYHHPRSLRSDSVTPVLGRHQCAVMAGQRCLRPARGGLRLLPRERPVFAPASETPIWPAGRKSTRAYPIATALATPILYPAREPVGLRRETDSWEPRRNGRRCRNRSTTRRADGSFVSPP